MSKIERKTKPSRLRVVAEAVLLLLGTAWAIGFVVMIVREVADAEDRMPGFLGIISVFFIYMAPTCIALLRGHHNVASICVVNFFLGWLIIGWVVALAWAVSNPAEGRRSP